MKALVVDEPLRPGVALLVSHGLNWACAKGNRFGGIGNVLLVRPLAGRRRREEGSARPARFLFVIPAHDEEANIRSTIESCRAVSYDPALFRVCVIADNCSDETARTARAAGGSTRSASPATPAAATC